MFLGAIFSYLLSKNRRFPLLALQRIPSTILKIGDVYGKMMNVSWKSETLRRTISKVYASFRDFLVFEIYFWLFLASTHMVGACENYWKLNFEHKKAAKTSAHFWFQRFTFWAEIDRFCVYRNPQTSEHPTLWEMIPCSVFFSRKWYTNSRKKKAPRPQKKAPKKEISRKWQTMKKTLRRVHRARSRRGCAERWVLWAKTWRWMNNNDFVIFSTNTVLDGGFGAIQNAVTD